MAYSVFVKFLIVIQFSIMLEKKSCNKTHFESFNTVSQVFPIFLCSLYYERATIFNLLCFGGVRGP